MSDDLEEVKKTIVDAQELYQAGVKNGEIKKIIFDMMSIKRENYEKLFSNIDEALLFNGRYWKHNSKSNFSSDSFKFDKYVHEVCFKAIEKLHPTTSVIARKSTKQLVELHCRNKFILKLDIKKYYESIDYSDIERSLKTSGVDKELAGYIKKFYFTKGKSLRRGLRASPILSEYIGLKIDNFVKKVLHEIGSEDVPYSRFYDDILLSSNDRELLRSIEKRIGEELTNLGFSINDRKTKIQPAHTANVLGLRIHNNHYIVPKAFKKKLRARINHLERYIYALHKSGEWDNSDYVYEAKVKVGTVIGSLWYIINNSNDDVSRYSLLLGKYYGVLAICSQQLNYLLGDEDIVEYIDE